MRKCILLIAVIVLTLSFTITASAEWQEKDGNTLWYNSDGTAATGFKNIDGTGYIFSSKGFLQGKYTGVTSSSKGRRYYLEGEVVKDRWLYSNGERTYYAGEDGYFLVGWQRFPDGFLYGFDENGKFIKTTRPDFCKTDAHVAEYHKLKNANNCLKEWYYEEMELYNSIEMVRDENGAIVGEEDGKDVRMLVRFWAKSEESAKEILKELEYFKIDSRFYEITVGENPADKEEKPLYSELYDKQDIKLSLKADSTSVTVTVENKADFEFNLFEHIIIERLNGDEWISLPGQGFDFITVVQPIAPNGSGVYSETLSKPLQPGTYRAVVRLSFYEIKILDIKKNIYLASQSFTVE